RLWREQEGRDPPFVDVRILADMKKTDREKDFAVIGELARLMTDPRDQLLYSRSARDLAELARAHPAVLRELKASRPLLEVVSADRARLEGALDRERRELMHANEARLESYRRAAARWEAAWTELERHTAGLPLLEAHARMVAKALDLLPFRADEPR